jgi:AraC-like DNA-binding protein
VRGQDHLRLRLIRLECTDQWACRWGGFSFVLPTAGQAEYATGLGAHRVGSGDVLVLKKETPLRVLGTGGFAFRLFSVHPEHLLPLFAAHEVPFLSKVTEGFGEAKLFPAATPVAKECHRLIGEVAAQFDLEHRSRLLRVAAAVFTQELKAAHHQRLGFLRNGEEFARGVEQLAADDLLNLPVEALGRKLGCGRRQLLRHFKQYFGMSIVALKLEVRLLKAISLLRDPDAKVMNVAEDCGFKHLGLFNACFKRRFGATPGRWQKLAAEAAGGAPAAGSGEEKCRLQLTNLRLVAAGFQKLEDGSVIRVHPRSDAEANGGIISQPVADAVVLKRTA